jgi:hypothetical protein
MSSDPQQPNAPKPCNDCDERFNTFFSLAKNTRAAQRSYFSTRSPEALQRAKQFERELDAAIKLIEEARAKKSQQQQPKLF